MNPFENLKKKKTLLVLVSIRNARKKILKRLVLGFVILSAVCLPAQVALAAGTAAGTPITNQATANYTVGSTNYTETSNTTTTRIAEILNVDLVWQDAGNVTVSPGDTGRVLTFQVTNTGNGTDDYTLAGLSTLGGDDFDPTLVGIYLDSDGNGAYDSGTDAQYILNTNDPVLAADASVSVFVLNNIPGSLSDNDLGGSRLTATSKTGNGADQAFYQVKKNGRNQMSSSIEELRKDKRIMEIPRNRSL